MVDCLLPNDPVKVLATGLNCPNFGLTEAAAIWICATAHSNNLRPVEELVALVPLNSFEDQTRVLTEMARLLDLSQVCLCSRFS